MSKFAYLVRSLARYRLVEAHRCPNCGSAGGRIVDRKFGVTALVRCAHCRLMFRTPADGPGHGLGFYNGAYRQGTAMALPSEAELAALVASNFAGSERDFAGYLDFLDRQGIARGGRLFDFGCSWGYGSAQFARAGFYVYGYEIGVARRAYGEELLGVRHVDEPEGIVAGHPLFGTFDCFFSAHVLEHVPRVRDVIALAWRCLKPGGAFVAFTPNGNTDYRAMDPRGWRHLWGGVHPNFLDAEFYDRAFARSRRGYGSRAGGPQSELGFVAFKDGTRDGF